MKVVIPQDHFNEKGMFLEPPLLPDVDNTAVEMYIHRYIDFFPKGCLKGKKVGIYQHSAVGRDILLHIFKDLGAEVTPLGFSDKFIPVDTEAIRIEDIEAANNWAQQYDFDTIVSTDGDSDRPLISDENGNWLRGDVAGILCAIYLNADTIATPVSCNSAVDKCGYFQSVIRTRIGSPYVIEAMQTGSSQGARRVMGYEANGGFLTNTDVRKNDRLLKALPTRDAVIVHLGILMLSIEKEKPISQLLQELPQRYTHSDRLKNFATEKSQAKLAELHTGDLKKDTQQIESDFGKHFGRVKDLDDTDGLRITFKNEEIVHLRPSGNAPEFRCYNEADSEARAQEMNRICLEIMNTWR